MERFRNDYFDKTWLEAPIHQRMLVFEFGRFATDIGLNDFQQDPTKGENEHIVGLNAEQFKERAEASGQSLALGAFGQVELDPEDQTFEARVIYDKDFFTSHSTKEGETFEEILPMAVEYEFRKMSTLLKYLSHTPDKVPDTFTGEDVFEHIHNTMGEALNKGTLDKYIEYLGVKADAEHPDDVKSDIVPTTMRDYIRQAFCEILDDGQDEDELLDEIGKISRNF